MNTTIRKAALVVVSLATLASASACSDIASEVQRERAENQASSCATEERTLRTSMEAFYAMNGHFPNDISQLVDAGLIRDADLVGGPYVLRSDGTVDGPCPS